MKHGHSHYNHEQHHEQRKRDEGADAKHLRSDGSVPIVGHMGRKIHGAHTGEDHPRHGGHLPTTHQEEEKPMAHLDSGSYPKKSGKPGDHEEEK